MATALMAAACTGPTAIRETDGEGLLRVFNGGGVSVGRGTAEVGRTYSAGSVPLCRQTDSEVMLRSIQAIEVFGQVRLEGIRVRTSHWAPPDRPSNPDRHMVGIMSGIPDGLRRPSGYRVPTSCDSPADPVGEVVVTLSKTGRAGGALKGLKLAYDVGDEVHVFRVPFEFQLCGTDDRVPDCEPSSSS